MGNRGCLHDERQHIQRLYQVKRWIWCKLEFKERRRPIMRPGHYTELFFLDEAVALAAGHRPCVECSQAKFEVFRRLWAEANPALAQSSKPLAPVIDAVLHQQRLESDGSNRKKVHLAQLSDLPPGSFITLPDNLTQPYLMQEYTLLPWTMEGYGLALARPTKQQVIVLTPASILRTLQLGYCPMLHPSATAGQVLLSRIGHGPEDCAS